MEGNSIYKYYQKVSDRYYVALRIPSKGKTDINYIWEPLARRVVITGFEDFDFFILGERSHLELCEGLSGLVIIRQCNLESRIMRRCNQKLFIECLSAEIRRKGGRANLNQAVVNFIWNHEQKISPRYNTKKL